MLFVLAWPWMRVGHACFISRKISFLLKKICCIFFFAQKDFGRRLRFGVCSMFFQILMRHAHILLGDTSSGNTVYFLHQSFYWNVPLP
jgi:hypothetical protein